MLLVPWHTFTVSKDLNLHHTTLSWNPENQDIKAKKMQPVLGLHAGCGKFGFPSCTLALKQGLDRCQMSATKSNNSRDGFTN